MRDYKGSTVRIVCMIGADRVPQDLLDTAADSGGNDAFITNFYPLVLEQFGVGERYVDWNRIY